MCSGEFAFDAATGAFADGVKPVGMLELKAPMRPYTAGDGIRDTYYCQIQGVAAVLGVPWCDFAQWAPRPRLRPDGGASLLPTELRSAGRAHGVTLRR